MKRLLILLTLVVGLPAFTQDAGAHLTHSARSSLGGQNPPTDSWFDVITTGPEEESRALCEAVLHSEESLSEAPFRTIRACSREGLQPVQRAGERGVVLRQARAVGEVEGGPQLKRAASRGQVVTFRRFVDVATCEAMVATLAEDRVASTPQEELAASDFLAGQLAEAQARQQTECHSAENARATCARSKPDDVRVRRCRGAWSTPACATVKAQAFEFEKCSMTVSTATRECELASRLVKAIERRTRRRAQPAPSPPTCIRD